jgi:hypothetical protein
MTELQNLKIPKPQAEELLRKTSIRPARLVHLSDATNDAELDAAWESESSG